MAKRRTMTTAEMRDAAKRIVKDWQPTAFFDSIEQAAQQVLRNHKIKDWPILPHGIDPDAPDEARHADGTLHWLRIIREQITTCRSPEGAALIARNAMNAGAMAGHLGIMIEAEHGATTMTHFRGAWIVASPLQRKILGVFADRDRVTLQEFVRECWEDRFLDRKMSKYRKAITETNRLILDSNLQLGMISIQDQYVELS